MRCRSVAGHPPRRCQSCHVMCHPQHLLMIISQLILSTSQQFHHQLSLSRQETFLLGKGPVWQVFPPSLTNHVKHSPSWETNSSSVGQEISPPPTRHILYTPKYSLLFSQQPSTGPYRWPDKFCPRPSQVTKVHFNIILPSTPTKRCLHPAPRP
jgi:hypothetical protein